MNSFSSTHGIPYLVMTRCFRLCLASLRYCVHKTLAQLATLTAFDLVVAHALSVSGPYLQAARTLDPASLSLFLGARQGSRLRTYQTSVQTVYRRWEEHAGFVCFRLGRIRAEQRR